MQEIAVEIADPCGSKVAAVAARDERDLVVQIEQIVVDRRRSKEDHLLVRTVPAAPAVAAEHSFEVAVAVGVRVAKVVCFVHKHHVRLAPGSRIESISTKLLLRKHRA